MKSHVKTYQKTVDKDFSARETESSIDEFDALVKKLADIGLRQVRATETFVANAFFLIPFGIDVNVSFGRIEQMSYADIKQIFEVFGRLTGT